MGVSGRPNFWNLVLSPVPLLSSMHFAKIAEPELLTRRQQPPREAAVFCLASCEHLQLVVKRRLLSDLKPLDGKCEKFESPHTLEARKVLGIGILT